MHPLHTVCPRRLCQDSSGLRFWAVRGLMISRVIDDSSQLRADLRQQIENVRLVEIVGEEVQFKRLVISHFIQKIEDELIGLESKPRIDIARDLLKPKRVLARLWDNV